MAKQIRVKCPACGEIVDLTRTGPCPRCGKKVEARAAGTLVLYRPRDASGSVSSYGVYLNGTPYGKIESRDVLSFPLPFGSYKVHVVCGMNRKCNDPVVTLSEAEPVVCLEVRIKMGFIQNSFVLERIDRADLPEQKA